MMPLYAGMPAARCVRTAAPIWLIFALHYSGVGTYGQFASIIFLVVLFAGVLGVGVLNLWLNPHYREVPWARRLAGIR